MKNQTKTATLLLVALTLCIAPFAIDANSNTITRSTSPTKSQDLAEDLVQLFIDYGLYAYHYDGTIVVENVEENEPLIKNEPLVIDIPQGIDVFWQATLRGETAIHQGLVTLSGEGSFVMNNGLIENENEDGGYAILVTSTTDELVIRINGSGFTGAAEAKAAHTAIFVEDGDVKVIVDRGRVVALAGRAIDVSGSESDAPLTISDGEVFAFNTGGVLVGPDDAEIVINGGVVFGFGDDAEDLIDGDYEINFLGVVIAWDESKNIDGLYKAGSTKNLHWTDADGGTYAEVSYLIITPETEAEYDEEGEEISPGLEGIYGIGYGFDGEVFGSIVLMDIFVLEDDEDAGIGYVIITGLTAAEASTEITEAAEKFEYVYVAGINASADAPFAFSVPEDHHVLWLATVAGTPATADGLIVLDPESEGSLILVGEINNTGGVAILFEAEGEPDSPPLIKIIEDVVTGDIRVVGAFFEIGFVAVIEGDIEVSKGEAEWITVAIMGETNITGDVTITGADVVMVGEEAIIEGRLTLNNVELSQIEDDVHIIGSVYAEESMLTISGGLVTGKVIADRSHILIDGGVLAGDDGHTLLIFGMPNELSNVTLTGEGWVANTSDDGAAVYLGGYGVFTMSGGLVMGSDGGAVILDGATNQATIVGGRIDAYEGKAIDADAGAEVTIGGEAVLFAYGTTLADVIATTPAFDPASLAGEAIAIALDEAEIAKQQEAGTSVGIKAFPETATAVWHVEDIEGLVIAGINYARGDNQGFIEIAGANVVEPDPASVLPGIYTQDGQALQAWVNDGVLYVQGLPAGQFWRIYTITGQLLHQGTATADIATWYGLRQRGTYIIQSAAGSTRIIF